MKSLSRNISISKWKRNLILKGYDCKPSAFKFLFVALAYERTMGEPYNGTAKILQILHFFQPKYY